MRITLLGTGTPMVDPLRQASALLIEVDEAKLLFDAGRGITGQLLKAGHTPQQINPIFITHHHYDHIGNLGDLLLTAWHNGRETPTDIYGPPGTAKIIEVLWSQVYARDITFARFFAPEGPDIRELVRVQEISAGPVCDTGDWRVLAEEVEHGHRLGLSREAFPCLGYRLEAGGKIVAISGDTVACAGLDRLAQGADLLIQCCYLAEAEITTPAQERSARYIIASSDAAGQIAARNGVKRLVLTHIRPKSEALLDSMLGDVRRHYQGELYLGEDMMTFEL
jgi:ribonuclease BN (tRNA processing enzyme)